MSAAEHNARIHVFLPVHNRRSVTEQFLRCLCRQIYTNWNLLLIDDGSSDGTGEMAKSLVPDLTLLRGEGHWWWAGSLHQGYQWLQRTNIPASDLVLMINDDTDIEPDFLSNAVRQVRPGSLLLAQAFKSNGEFCEAGVSWDWENLTCTGVKSAEGINCFSTRGLFLFVGDFLRIGGFYPRLLPHYLSDYEFTMRAHRKGFALITSSDVRLRYFEALTGIRSTEGHPVWKALMTNLSIKSSANPIYWTSFVLLASPGKYLPYNLVKVWWRYFRPALAPALNLLSSIRKALGKVKRKVKQEWLRRDDGMRAGRRSGHHDD